jgi:hypothetical protein
VLLAIRLVCILVCMHTNKKGGMERIIQQMVQMDAADLDRLQAAIDSCRASLAEPGEHSHAASSVVLERRGYGQGVLQLESRTYRRKDGSLSERGPYWYFHYREGGRQRTVYVGKTSEPEKKLAEKLS